jgi:hypothetical protein
MRQQITKIKYKTQGARTNSQWVIAFFLLSLAVFAQSPKQVPYLFYGWEIPNVSLAEEATAKTISVQLFNGEPSLSLKIIRPNSQSNITEEFKNIPFPVANFSNTNDFIFNTYQLTNAKNADLQMEVVAGQPQFIITSSERIYGEFIGSLHFVVPIQTTVFNVKGEIVYKKRYDKPAYLDNGSSSRTAQEAIESMRIKFFADQLNYTSQARNSFVNEIVFNCAKELIQDLDYKRSKTKTCYFYTIKNKGDFDFTENNNYIEKTIPAFKETDSDNYAEQLKKGLQTSIDYWEKEVEKYKGLSQDKDVKKIIWAFYSNLNAAYFAIEEYDKATQAGKKAMETEINGRYNYILEMPNEYVKKMEFHKHDGKFLRDFTQYKFHKSNDSKLIQIIPFR